MRCGGAAVLGPLANGEAGGQGAIVAGATLTGTLADPYWHSAAGIKCVLGRREKGFKTRWYKS